MSGGKQLESKVVYEVIVLKEGYSKEDNGCLRSCGTVTLVKGLSNIIVDTGNPWDKDIIIDGLRKHGLTPDKIQYVVCTHGHSDHVGNLNLFPNAMHIVCYDICLGDQYIQHNFRMGYKYEIDNYVEVVPTPGHTGADVSVFVMNTEYGVVAITGDLFECFEDLENPALWQESSENPELQQLNRRMTLRYADTIIPGHGPLFKVPHEHKQQMKMVMLYEESCEIGLETSVESSGIIFEVDD